MGKYLLYSVEVLKIWAIQKTIIILHTFLGYAGDIRLGWVKLIMKSSNEDSDPTTGGVRKAGHTLEDRNKKKAGALYHALGSHSYPKKRGCSPPRTEVAKGGLALPESPRGLQLSTSWPELPVTGNSSSRSTCFMLRRPWLLPLPEALPGCSPWTLQQSTGP